MTKTTGLVIRWVIGLPTMAMLCLVITFFISMTIRSGSVRDHLTGTGFTAFFVLQAYAIWRILLFRRAEVARLRPSVGGGGSPGSGSLGGDLPPRPPDAGKPAPLIPPQTHHLAAAQELPPSDKTQSLPHDLHEG